MKRRRRARMAVTNLHGHFERAVREHATAPVESFDFKLFHEQILGVADKNSICLRFDTNHVARPWRSARKALALTNCEHLNSFMFAEEVAREIVDTAAM